MKKVRYAMLIFNSELEKIKNKKETEIIDFSRINYF